MRADRLDARFVDEIPETLDSGRVYVSLEHATMVHLCACGCGHEVVLPLTPLDWRLTWDGERISVSPSVGSWSLPCRSHYVIGEGRVRWAGDWSDEEIEAGRRRDLKAKARRHATAPTSLRDDVPEMRPVEEAKVRHSGLLGWFRRITRR